MCAGNSLRYPREQWQPNEKHTVQWPSLVSVHYEELAKWWEASLAKSDWGHCREAGHFQARPQIGFLQVDCQACAFQSPQSLLKWHDKPIGARVSGWPIDRSFMTPQKTPPATPCAKASFAATTFALALGCASPWTQSIWPELNATQPF